MFLKFVLSFKKRDIILVVAVFLIMIGLIPFTAPIYAAGIAIALYFGIKVFIGRRNKKLQNEIGEGFCAECGQKIIDKKCPSCDKPSK